MIKVIKIHPKGAMNVCTNFWDLSEIWNVNLMIALEEIDML